MTKTIINGLIYEPAEVGSAKNVVQYVLEEQILWPDDPENERAVVLAEDAIDLADAIVEALLKVGVTIPEGLVA